GRPRALNFEVRPVGDTALLLNAGGAQIKLACNLQSTPDYDNLRRFYVREFNDADVAQKGYLVLKDLTPQRFQAFRPFFAAADRNGDGKLTVKELNAYIDLQAQLAAAYTSLGVTDQGRGLFEALDANHDGRLSLRELRTAWQRLAPWDRNGDGCIDKPEIPGQFLITASRGRVQFNGRPSFGGPAMFAAPVPTRGPLWFRKMDRNGDGDVSRL